MTANDWLPKLLTDPQQPGSDFRFGTDASQLQYPVPGLLDYTPTATPMDSSMKTSDQVPDQGARAAYGETRGLYPQQTFPGSIYNMDSWDPASATNLDTARTWIAEVQKRNKIMQYADRPSGGNSIENNQWQFAANAAKNAGSLSPSDVQRFFIRQDGVGQQTLNPRDGKLYKSFGPFINTGGGDVPRGNSTYIDFYKVIK